MADGADTPQPQTNTAPAPAASSTPAPQDNPSVGGGVQEAEAALNAKLSKVYDALTAAPDPKKSETPAGAPTEAAPAEGAEPTSDQPTASGPELAQSSPAIAAPASWSAEVKPLWKDIPPKAQEFLAQREREFHKEITQKGNELKAYEPLRPVYQALNQHWRVPQGREPEVIESWMRAQHALDTNPVEALKWLAQSYRVDPAQLVAGTAKPAVDAKPSGANPTGDPQLDDLFKDPRIDSQLLPTLQELQKKIEEQEQFNRYIAHQQAAREHAEQARREDNAKKAIAEFRTDKPYFDELEDDIVDEVRILRAKEPGLSQKEVLDKAYTRAMRKNDAVFQRVQDEQRKQDEAKSKAEAAKKAAEAKKLASMNVRSGTSTPAGTTKGKFLDDDVLSATFDRINAG